MWFYRQGGKDQTKKGPNMKLGPQGDKKGLGQDLRKDSSMDSGHHLKVWIYSLEIHAVASLLGTCNVLHYTDRCFYYFVFPTHGVS